MFSSQDKNHLESTGAANCSSSAPTKPFSQARLQFNEYGDGDDNDNDEDDEEYRTDNDYEGGL